MRCQALRNLFEWLGGVPERIVYDNAAGVGRKWFDGIPRPACSRRSRRTTGSSTRSATRTRDTRRAASRPGSGPCATELFDAGARRMEPRQLQPAPARPLPRTGGQDHYRKGESQTGLFDEDRKALLPLPAKPFDVVTWTRMKADKYGNITVQGPPPVRGPDPNTPAMR